MTWFGRLFDRIIGPITEADHRYAAVDRELDELSEWERTSEYDRRIKEWELRDELEPVSDRIQDWQYAWDAMVDDEENIRDEQVAIVDDEE